MKNLPLALLISMVTLSALAAGEAGKVVSNEVAIKGDQKLVFSSNKGNIKIGVSKNGTVSYKVEFVPDQKPSWWERGSAPSPKAFEDCTAEYTPEGGLKVTTAEGIGAVVILNLPDRQPLDAQLSSGILAIAARTGKVDAFIGKGILEYDSAGLPAGFCVTASINAGTVKNTRDFNCANVGAVLHGHSGIITVK